MAPSNYSPMPDIEGVVCAALRSADICDGRVYTSVPKSPVWPLAIVQRLGGTPTEPRRIDAARIQIDVHGGLEVSDKGPTRDEADAARLATHELEGTNSSTWNAAVTAVRDEMGLTWIPDSSTGRARYTFSVIVTAHDFQG